MPHTYFIYSTFTPNGAANNRALAYIKALSAEHYPVTVLFVMPDDRMSRIEEQLPDITVEYCWDKNYINRRFFKNFSYILYLWRIYKRLKPGDIVYLYGEVDLMILLNKKKGIHLFCERTEHPNVYHPKGRLITPSINKYITECKKLDGLFVISTCLRDFFVENGIDRNKVTIVNSIVDTTRFDGIVKQPCESYFAYCGNGNNKKDKVDELIKVFARVAERHHDIKFYIIGPTTQVYKDETDNVQLVHELGLDDLVIFTGMKPAAEIPQLLVNAKALFLTRPDTLQNRAGFSTKLGEYLASGNPVVAAGVGDIPLYLKNNENAFVYTPGNYHAVEVAMECILAHPDEAKEVGQKGRIVAHTYFNAMIETKKLIAAFNEVKEQQ